VAGVVAGFAIGVLAALLGVAGGELLIPTLLLLFGADIKLAGSLSLTVSLPTMLIGFARYSRDRSFAVLVRNRLFAFVVAAGSIIGTFLGGRLLGLVPSFILLPLLVRPSRWIRKHQWCVTTFAPRQRLALGRKTPPNIAMNWRWPITAISIPVRLHLSCIRPLFSPEKWDTEAAQRTAISREH
jgi:hypothetical protein